MVKRKTRASSAEGLAAGQLLKRAALSDNSAGPWAWVDTEAADAAHITAEHRQVACGLSARNRHPFCRNKLKPIAVRDTPAADPDEVIVISDDDEPSCSKKLCKANPNCLNYFNVNTWADQDKANEAFLKAVDMDDDPTLSAREPDLPVGLKNLGATCYANASLQVWYRDETFRRGVYACRPQEGAEEAFKNSPLYQLQTTFAALEECTQNFYNPVKLIDSLKLNTTEQQDAQEFSKLFLSHLDSEFKKQSSPSLSSLVDDQFQGKKVYGTRCGTCGYQSERPDEFREIEISFKNNAKLEDCISDSLQSEKLEGDNKYYCSQCASLQDATRYTNFLHFPPVLNFSLIRFVYDYDNEERKKLKNNISFPVQIDMGPFIGDAASRNAATQQENIYDLRGVLLHKGPSAHHGHYEAQAYDHSTKTWFQFNDEWVTKIKKLGKPPIEKEVIDLDDDAEKRPRPRPRPLKKAGKPRRVDDSDEEEPEAGKDQEKEKSQSPSKLQSKSPVINEVSSKDAYMLIYAKRAPTNAPKRQAKAPVDDVAPSDDVLGEVHDLNNKYDEECERFSERQKVAEKHLAQKRRTVIDIYQSWSVRSMQEESVIVPRKALEDWLAKHAMQEAAASFTGTNSKGKGKGKDTAKSGSGPTSLADSDFSISLSVADIVCDHGLLDPEKASEMKRITARAFKRIAEETNCRFEKRCAPGDVCAECVAALFKERLYDIRHPQDVAKFEHHLSEETSPCGYFISKAWLKDWKQAKPKMHVPCVDDPHPGCDEFGRHVQCEHGDLSLNGTSRRAIPVEACEVLTALFPQWQPISSDAEPCEVCTALIEISKGDKLELRKKGENEKAKLKHLATGTAPEDGDASGSASARARALVPIAFLKSWRQWLTRPTELPRPEKLDNAPYFCQHGLLLLDPNVAADWELSHSAVAMADWTELENSYAAGPLIAVQKHPDGRLSHDIPVCEACRRTLKRDWEEAGIFVSTGGGKSIEPGVASRKNGARQSKRLRQVKAQGERRQFIVRKGTTVKDIKVMVDKEFNISPILQRLFHDGKELSDNTATVESLDILRDDVLELREDKEILEISDSDDVPESKKRRKEEAEKGFGGTLLGGSGERTSDSREQTDNDEATASGQSVPSNEKPCKACTFINDADATACGVCDSPFTI